MSFTKPVNVTFQEISEHSGVGLRTVKRYAAGGNATTRNAKAIEMAVAEIQYTQKKTFGKSIIPISQKEFFFPKSMFKQPLFWSSPVDKMRSIDGVIETYTKTPNLYDIHILVRLFGEKRVMRVADRVYMGILKDFGMSPKKLSSLPEYQAVTRMVQYSLKVKS